MQQLFYNFLFSYFCLLFQFIKLPGNELYEKTKTTPNALLSIFKISTNISNFLKEQKKKICLLNGKEDDSGSGVPLCKGA